MVGDRAWAPAKERQSNTLSWHARNSGTIFVYCPTEFPIPQQLQKNHPRHQCMLAKSCFVKPLE